MQYLNAFNKIPGVGSQKLGKLATFFPNFETAWKASYKDLIASGLGEKLAQKIILERKNIQPEKEWEILQKENIQLLSLHSQNYPRLLKEIANPPFVLYAKGNFDFNLKPLISVVGSRKYSSYGSQVAQSLVRDLSKAGIAIVSGMALGIDSIAHRASLSEMNPTIAILGNSLEKNSIYPKNNFNLSLEICENGLLLSEYPVPTSAGIGTFPARNRLIAGISLGTLVIEAGEKSGSLITTSLALEYNREVFAVPGSIFSPESLGTNRLIQNGAKATLSAKDILEEIGLEEKASSKDFSQASSEEKLLLEILSREPLHIDKLMKVSKLGTMTVSATLSLMEIKGWVKNIGGSNYIII